LVTKVKHLNKMAGSWKEPPPCGRIQLVAMSATVGNLRELAHFLQAELFTDVWRPVRLEEYVKVGRDLFQVDAKSFCGGEEFRLVRRLDVSSYTQTMKALDEDYLTELVLEVSVRLLRPSYWSAKTIQ
jgi:POLQ-like helicase